MEYLWVAFIVIILAGSGAYKRHHARVKADAHADTVASLRQIDTSDATATATDGERRAKRIAGRKSTDLVSLEVIGRADLPDEGANTYWAAYEMIVRGLQVTLDMQEIHQEKGGFGAGGFDLAPRPTVISRMTYTTEAFIPHLRAIDSFETFGRYAPFRADRTLKLTVHPDDLTDAYDLLRQLGIRLSVMHHPDQHWWKGEE
jgi:hypothetical protein